MHLTFKKALTILSKINSIKTALYPAMGYHCVTMTMMGTTRGTVTAMATKATTAISQVEHG